MENQTRFDLNLQIKKWRDSLRALWILDAERILELESNLKEATAELHGKGLSQAEAFSVAVRRLEDPRGLKGQFGRDGRLAACQRAIFWMVA